MIISKKTVFTAIIFFTLTILITGLFSELCLGDEVYNFRFAKYIFLTGKRVSYDPLYGINNFPVYYFTAAPLWHFLLAYLWKTIGYISIPLAQVYHIFYYLLLVFFTYLLGKELYTEKEGLYAALFISTLPMVISFSILFYLDVPLAAFSTLCFLLIKKQKFILAGIIFGLMFLTKITAIFFALGFILLNYYYSLTQKLSVKVKNIFTFSFFSTSIIFCDFMWRYTHLRVPNVVGGGFVSTEVKARLVNVPFVNKIKPVTEYLNSYLYNPLDIIKYLGIIFLTMFILYFIFRKFQKDDIKIFIPILSYMLGYICIFGLGSDIRYMMPIIPFMVILASKTAVTLLKNNRKLNLLLLLLCFLQLFSVCFYVFWKRRISPEIKEGFAYIKTNIPQHALIMYPEENLLLGTERRIIWGSLKNFQAIFWADTDSELIKYLKENNVDYIAVKKTRIYDDSKVHHFGGYPKSFVEKLKKSNLFSLVFSNSQIDIWKINYAS